MRTRVKLAHELRAVAARASTENTQKYEALARRAETGEFDDFGDVHPCGPTALFNELMAVGFRKFAERVLDGEFDATEEESAEWANSPAGRAAMQRFSAEERARLFGVYDA